MEEVREVDCLEEEQASDIDIATEDNNSLSSEETFDEDTIVTFGYESIKNSPYSATIVEPPTVFHKTSFYKIIYIESGSAKIYFISQKTKGIIERKCNVGDAFIVTPDDIQKYAVFGSKQYRHREIYASPKTVKDCCNIISSTLYEEIKGADSPNFFRISPNDIISMEGRLSFFVNRLPSVKLNGVHKSLIVSMLGVYYTFGMEKKVYPDWINELLIELEKIEVLRLPIEKIITKTKYSHSYICREFKRHVGTPLKQYIIDKRLELSKLLMLNGNKSLKEIALLLGLGTSSNFIKAFNNKYGASPKKYLKSSMKR